jgi:hypothetical protein
MAEKMFVTVWGLQKAEIEAHCFGSCKKVIFGLLMDEQFGALSHCFEVNCPFVEKEMSEPFGEVDGVNAYLRKLQPPNTACSGLAPAGASESKVVSGASR